MKEKKGKNNTNTRRGRRRHFFPWFLRRLSLPGRWNPAACLPALCLAAALALFSPFPLTGLAGTWDQTVENSLGKEQKEQMEQQAQAAAAEGRVQLYWSAPLNENGEISPGINNGIPNNSIFYSSIDQVWQPLVRNVVYTNSVHQFGGETGTVYISWNNGRGRLFAYSKEQYWAIQGVIQAFKDHCIRAGMSDFEKEMAIVQYLVGSVTYPYARYRAGLDTKDDHSAFGALVKGEAVCEGYAEAFCWLADAVGLETKFIYGVYGGEMHDWNLVRLDGQWYHVDVTSDDPEAAGGANGFGWGNLRNQYLNLTDSQMARDHWWEPLADTPCQAAVYGPAAVAAYLHGGND